MANCGFAGAIAAGGVTPQAQKTGSSSPPPSTVSPQSGMVGSRMPMCTGAACTDGKREVIALARMALATGDAWR